MTSNDRRQAEIGRHDGDTDLRPHRVQVHHTDDRVVGDGLGVGDERIVLGLQEADVIEGLQRRMLPADPVQCGHEREQGTVERALLHLELL